MNIAIVNCFDTYEDRIDLLYKIFVKAGHRVNIYSSNFKHIEKCKREESKKGYIFFNALPYHKNLSFHRLLSHYKLSKDIFRHLETNQIQVDLLWVVVPPNSFVKDASDYIKQYPHVKLVYDVIDLWPETMPVKLIKDFFPFSLWKNLRDKHLNSADLIVTECNLYQEKLRNILNDKKEMETLYLSRPLIPYKPNLRLPKDRISLCYLGSINNIIDVNVIQKIIVLTKRFKPVDIHIIGDGEQRDYLLNACENVGATVIFHGKMYDRVEKQKIFDSCHFGLNIMKDSVCVGLTMKSLDYLEFGLPIINNIHGDTWNFIKNNSIGYNIDTYYKINEFNYDLTFRTNVRNFFEQEFCEDRFVEKINRILSAIKFK